jgi:hypothetical protein
MERFFWNLSGVLVLLLFLYSTSVLITTLVFAHDIDNANSLEDINMPLLTYIKVGNWIYVASLSLSLIYVVLYQHSIKSIIVPVRPLSTSLHKK